MSFLLDLSIGSAVCANLWFVVWQKLHIQYLGFSMKLTPPSFLIFLISICLFAIAVLPLFGISMPKLGITTSNLLIISWTILAAGVLFKGL